MKKIGKLIAIFTVASLHIINAQTFTVAGGSKPTYSYPTVSSSGLEAIFLFYGMEQAELTYVSPTPNSTITWYQYQEDPSARISLSGNKVNDTTYVLSGIAPDSGYIVNDNGDEYAVWVIDYSQYIPVFQSLEASFMENDKCDNVYLTVSGNIPALTYRTFTTGDKEEILREYTINYQTLTWDNSAYSLHEVETKTKNITSPARVRTPLANTTFTLLGDDELAQYFGEIPQITSAEFEAIAVELRVNAEVQPRENLNERDKPKFENDEFSGSAPIEIIFFSNASDAAQHFSWEFSRREDFSMLEASYPERNLNYTFAKTGLYYVRLVASDYDNNCSVVSDVFKVFVSESFIDAPNYFTPNASEGINDEFKVVYRSIDQFRCTIYNRWGNPVYEYTDPALGWDGRKNGVFVPPGVYYYIIEAKGADGIEHKRKGEINILYEK